MSKNHNYIIGINAYDHDVSACLLRDGEIAFAIAKERITRQKARHADFIKEVVDYCLDAEGITLDDVDLVVRNCYILPVEEMEERLLHHDMPAFMDEEERAAGSKPSALSFHAPNKVVTVSHHLAHAYSAFAACPFDEGVVMVVDGVGSYGRTSPRTSQLTENVDPLARESESYYKFKGSKLETLKKVWLDPVARISERRVLQHAGPRRVVQPGVELHFRRLEQVRRGDGPGSLRPPGRSQAAPRHQERRAGRSGLDGRVQAAVADRQPSRIGKHSPSHAALEGHGLARPGRHRDGAARIAPDGCARPPAPRISASPAASR